MTKEKLAETIKELLEEISKVRRYDISTEVDGDLEDIHQTVLGSRVLALHQRYRFQLRGTPEADYLAALVKMYSSPEAVESVEPEQLYQRPVTELELSVRGVTTLNNMGIKYIGEMVQRSEADFLNVKNCGRQTIKEFKSLLNDVGLELDTKLDGFIPPSDSFEI